ncbi:DUF5808 domain-containing protein [uncultured Clostridium sp.]|uniref:DUF5808 domain-containing protein n=1 Tax=uncultured Clostridium sp. TaxID=59620 RepID=UPI0032176E8D
MDRWLFLAFMNSILLVIFLISYFINNTSNNGIFFGVRFPKEYQGEKELKDIEKSYRKIISTIFLIMFIGVNLIFFNLNNYSEDILGDIMGITTVGSLVISFLVYIPYYKKAKILKKDKNWTYAKRNVVVVETTLRKPKKDEKIKPIDSKWFLMLFLFSLISIGLTMYKYDALPKIMEIPHTSFGEFNKDTLRGFLIIYQFPIVQIFLAALLYGINKVIISSKVDLNSGSIEKAITRKKKFKKMGSIIIMIMALETLILFSLIQASILFNFDSMIINYIFMIIQMITIIIFIIVFIKVGQGGRNITIKDEKDEKDELYKDDDDKWILGSIYYNKNDPAWMVEKRLGVGWTVNFAHPKSWIAVGGLVVFIIGSIVMSVLLK